MKRLFGVILASVIITVAVLAVCGKNTDAKGAITASTPAVREISYTTEEISTETDKRIYTEADIVMLAKLLWGEARGVKSETEQAAVVWCVLNRVDSSAWPDTISDVITQPHQFVGYDPDYPVTEGLRKIADDVLCRWYLERAFNVSAMRVLPPGYVYFTGDGTQNYFRIGYEDGTFWDWSLESPYAS